VENKKKDALWFLGLTMAWFVFLAVVMFAIVALIASQTASPFVSEF